MSLIAAAAEGHGETNVLALPLDEIIIGAIAFFVVLFVLAKFGLPQIKRILDEREDLIEGGLQRADNAQAEAQATLDQYREQLAEARTEAASIRAQAQAEKALIIEEARREAQVAAKAEADRATASIAAEKAKALSELRSDVGRTATDLAGRIVGEALDDDARSKAVVDRFIADLEATAAGESA